jgi:hypothetical protein
VAVILKAGMQECRNAGMQECRNAGMQEYVSEGEITQSLNSSPL